MESPSGAGKTHFLKQLSLREPSRYVYSEASQWLDISAPVDGRCAIVDGLDELAFQNRARRHALLATLSQRLNQQRGEPQLIIATRLGTWTSEDSRHLSPNPAKKIVHIGLAYLDNEDIRVLARDLGIEDVEGFILRGPASLCGLYPYEVEIFARSRVEYSGSWVRNAKVLLEASFASSARHVQSLTLEKWSAGLCRLAAAACLMERQTFVVDLGISCPDALQAWRLLPDWTPAEQRELFSSSFFGKKGDSIYMLRGGLLKGRGLAVLLAAFWCTERLNRGVEPDACKLWADDVPSGRRHVPKRLRSLLGWVGSSVPSLHKELTSRNPEIWLAGGDLTNLPNLSDTAIRAFERFLELANEDMFLPRIEDVTIYAIAPHLAARLDLKTDIYPLRRLHFRIRAAARLVTVWEAVAFADALFKESEFGTTEFDASAGQDLREAIKNMQRSEREQIAEMANATPAHSRMLLKLSSSELTIEYIAAVLTENADVFRNQGRSENFLRFVARHLVGRRLVNVAKCLASATTLGESRHTPVPYLLQFILERQERPSDVGTIAELLVDIQINSQWTEHEFERTGSFDTDAKSPFPGKVIKRRLKDDASLREAFWRCFLESASTRAPLLWHSKLLFIELELRDVDTFLGTRIPDSPFKGILDATKAKAEADASRSVALGRFGAAPLVQLLRRPTILKLLAPYVQWSIVQAGRLLSAPAETLREFLTKDAKNDYWYVSYNIEMLKERYGAAMMPYIRDAAGRVWRSFTGPLKESHTQISDLDIDLYLAAVDLECQISELKISPQEAVTALKIASWAENSFPLWMWEVENSSQEGAKEIAAVLRSAIDRIWDQTPASPWLLEHTLLGPLARTLAGIVAERLEERPPACKVLSIESVWLLRYLEDQNLVRRIIARREDDMPEAAHLWVDLLANWDLAQAESRVCKLLGASQPRLPSFVDAVLRERPDELHPNTLLCIARFIAGLEKSDRFPSSLGACVRGIIHNKVADPRGAFAQIRSLLAEQEQGEESIIQDWMHFHAVDSWASLSCRFTDEDQILSLERADECQPHTLDELWRLVRRHIQIVKREAESGDFSARRIFGVIEEYRRNLKGQNEPKNWEILAQLWFAEQLRLIGRGLYHVAREEEVYIHQDRIDISACAGRFRVPIEIKLIEYSETELQGTIQHQLLNKYMKPDAVQFGVLLIVRMRDKPFDNAISFDVLLEKLRQFANRVLSGTSKVISVVGVDLVHQAAGQRMDGLPRTPAKKVPASPSVALVRHELAVPKMPPFEAPKLEFEAPELPKPDREAPERPEGDDVDFGGRSGRRKVKQKRHQAKSRR